MDGKRFVLADRAAFSQAVMSELVDNRMDETRRAFDVRLRTALPTMTEREWENFVQFTCVPLTADLWDIALAAAADHALSTASQHRRTLEDVGRRRRKSLLRRLARRGTGVRLRGLSDDAPGR